MIVLAFDRDWTVDVNSHPNREAEDFPESVEHVIPTVIDLLTDDDPTVRENACWILGYLRATEAQVPFETRIDDEMNPDVRTRAAWARSQIESV